MMNINTKCKRILDTIHGLINISDLAVYIIDTIEFQRLRYIKQLGTCFYIYPNSVHTRFEHSLGTYYLTGEMLKAIIENTDKDSINKWMSEIDELKNYYQRIYGIQDHFKLDKYVCELIKIAALTHDSGHECFSHTFDDVFIPYIHKIRSTKFIKMDKHEYRSCVLLENIITNHPILSTIIQPDEIKFMQNLICPSKQHIGFIYQIVSNSMNGIDVDKFDYMARDTHNLAVSFSFNSALIINNAIVIDNNICYPKEMDLEIVNLFATRYRLHKQIYTHKTVIAVRYMICEIMLLLDPIIDIYKDAIDVTIMCRLTDDYILSMVNVLYKTKDKYDTKYHSNIETAHDIWIRLNTRKIYKHIGTLISNKPHNITIDNIHKIDPDIDEKDILITNNKIGYISGTKKNPLNSVYFYNKKDPTCSFKVNKKEISYLIPNTYQEYQCIIYVKDKNNKILIDKMKEIFSQLST